MTAFCLTTASQYFVFALAPFAPDGGEPETISFYADDYADDYA